MRITELNALLDQLIEFGPIPKGWKRPVILRAQNKQDLLDAFDLWGHDPSHGAFYSPSPTNKKRYLNEWRNQVPGIRRKTVEDLRTKGMIIAPTETSSIGRLEKKLYPGAFKNVRDANKAVLRHELVHALRHPGSLSKASRRNWKPEGILKTAKEEWAANAATLLGRRGKALGTPFLSRLKAAAKGTFRSILY